MKLYEKTGVKEYCMADPMSNTLYVYKLKNNEYGRPEIYTEEDKVKVGIFPDLEIDMAMVFEPY